jgi:hypothetical protein
MVRELYALADTSPALGPAPPTSRALRWYLFTVAAFWIYTRFCRRQLAVEAVAVGATGRGGAVAAVLGWLVRRHNLTAFMLYTAGERGERGRGESGEREKTLLSPAHPTPPRTRSLPPPFLSLSSLE